LAEIVGDGFVELDQVLLELVPILPRWLALHLLGAWPAPPCLPCTSLVLGLLLVRLGLV
jgi:hypothetical protein